MLRTHSCAQMKKLYHQPKIVQNLTFDDTQSKAATALQSFDDQTMFSAQFFFRNRM